MVGFCRFCYGTDQDANIQTHFHDCDFIARTKESHDADVHLAQLTGTTTLGVKKLIVL